jgi:AcrR family transcriptional regulator
VPEVQLQGSGDCPVPTGHPAAKQGRPRDAELDGRILDATLALLTERGFEHTTMDDVAQRASVAKATVYRRYSSKEELAVDAVKRLFDREVPVPDTGSFREDLEQVYADLLTFAATPHGQALVRLAVTESCREARVGAMYLAWLRRREATCQLVFERAVDRGELREDAPQRLVFEWVPGMIVLRAVMGDEPMDPSAAAMLVDLALRGVAP